MPTTEKNSRLTDLFADELVGVVDDVRREIHAALGTRPWRTFIVVRRWSGPSRGIGTPSYSYRELDPPPEVEMGVGDRLGPAGREASRQIKVTKVSLAYSEQELQPPVDARTEVAYLFRDRDAPDPPGKPDKVHRADVWGVLASSPIPRLGDRSGDQTDWKLTLNQTSAMGVNDGVDEP